MSEIENPTTLHEIRNDIRARAEERIQALSGEPDLEGNRVTSLSAEAAAAVEPISTAWAEHALQKHSIPDDRVYEAYENDPSFRADVDAAKEQYAVLTEGARRAFANRESAEFNRLRPQAGDGGETDRRFSKDAIDYLIQVKGLTPQQAGQAYMQGGLGKASEQVKLFDASNTWARDKRELSALNAKRDLNESMTLREAQRRQTLMKRLGRA
jgi:hypothetical protein